ncbi:MAG: protein kinase [Polyangiaceae bacterium]|nr:protein kinase [Polyangiaceae bacterium]
MIDVDASSTRSANAPDVAGRGGPDERIGTLISGRWTIMRRLGAGGMGSVYEARHHVLGRPVAIKFLHSELAVDPEMSRRFTNEALALGPLTHPNLVAITDIGTADDGASYIVMDLLAGQDGAALLADVGVLPAERAADIVLQACRGLAVAHAAGLVHRDIKPENLFITDAGDGTDLVKVLDFGIAKRLATTASTVTRSGMIMGTVYYMSPEQAVSSTDVDRRTDIWSLGAVLYELLSGRRPFGGADWSEVLRKIVCDAPRPLHELCPGIPDQLVAVVDTALAKRVSDRYPSMEALAEVLAPLSGRRSLPSGSAGTEFAVPAPPVASLAPETRATPETGSASVAVSTAPKRSAARRVLAVLVGVALVAVGLGLASGLGLFETRAPRGARSQAVKTPSSSGRSAVGAAPAVVPTERKGAEAVAPPVRSAHLSPATAVPARAVAPVRRTFASFERTSSSPKSAGTSPVSGPDAAAPPLTRQPKGATSRPSGLTPAPTSGGVDIDTVSPY